MTRCRGRVVALGMFSLLLSAGCLGRQVKRDGVDLRQGVMQLYTDQAMDNLISAYENKPFVQVAYTKVSVNDTDTVKALGDFEQTVDQTRPLAVAAFAKFTRSLKNFWSLEGDLTRSRKLSFYANPVTNADDVYEAYLQFAANPNLFRVTTERPPCDVHVMKKCHGRYYWVPLEAAPAYQELLLHTTFMRGEDTIVGYRERRCAGLRLIEHLTDEKKQDAGDRYWFDFDAPVPNDQSTLVIVLPDGRKYKHEALKDATVKEGDFVSSLEVQVKPGEPLRDVLGQLPGSLVRVYSNHYPPEVRSSARTGAGLNTDGIERSLDRIRQTR